MAIISTMKTVASTRPKMVPETCAKCGKQAWESLALLDDAYAVWIGKCPHCGAHNLLDFSKGGRGYHSGGMALTLPTKDEIEQNGWPEDWPTCDGPGRPA